VQADQLGTFELYVLASLAHLGDDAYGVTIRRAIGDRSGRLPSFGAVYSTLERLAEKGYVSFRVSAPQPIPGGRSRKYAGLTAPGRRAMRDSARVLNAMLAGLDLELGGR